MQERRSQRHMYVLAMDSLQPPVRLDSSLGSEIKRCECARAGLSIGTVFVKFNASSVCVLPVAHSDSALRRHFEGNNDNGTGDGPPFSPASSIPDSPPPVPEGSQQAKKPSKHKMAKKILHKMGLQRKKKPDTGGINLDLDLSASVDDRHLMWSTRCDSGASLVSDRSICSSSLSGVAGRNGCIRTNSRSSEFSGGSFNAEPPGHHLHSWSDGEQTNGSSTTRSSSLHYLSIPSGVRPSSSALVRMHEIDLASDDSAGTSPQTKRAVGATSSLLRTKEKVCRE